MAKYALSWNIFWQTNLAMENEAFEDVFIVFPVENGDFPASYVSLPESMMIIFPLYTLKIMVDKLPTSTGERRISEPSKVS